MKVVQKLKVVNGCTKAQMDVENTVVKDPDVLTTHCDSVCITDLKMINPPSQKVAYWFSGNDFQGWRQKEAMTAWD